MVDVLLKLGFVCIYQNYQCIKSNPESVLAETVDCIVDIFSKIIFYTILICEIKLCKPRKLIVYLRG